MHETYSKNYHFLYFMCDTRFPYYKPIHTSLAALHRGRDWTVICTPRRDIAIRVMYKSTAIVPVKEFLYF